MRFPFFSEISNASENSVYYAVLQRLLYGPEKSVPAFHYMPHDRQLCGIFLWAIRHKSSYCQTAFGDESGLLWKRASVHGLKVALPKTKSHYKQCFLKICLSWEQKVIFPHWKAYCRRKFALDETCATPKSSKPPSEDSKEEIDFGLQASPYAVVAGITNTFNTGVCFCESGELLVTMLPAHKRNHQYWLPSPVGTTRWVRTYATKIVGAPCQCVLIDNSNSTGL